VREDVKMFYRPPLLEEPCAQTLSGIKGDDFPNIKHDSRVRENSEVVKNCPDMYIYIRIYEETDSTYGADTEDI